MERAGRLLGKLRFPSDVTPEDRARAAWSAAVGKKIANRTRVFGLVRSTLVIEVDDMVWQRQLTALRGQILKNLRDTLGPDLVTDLDFRPMIPRPGPQQETSARIARPAGTDELADPALRIVYRNAQKKAAG